MPDKTGNLSNQPVSIAKRHQGGGGSKFQRHCPLAAVSMPSAMSARCRTSASGVTLMAQPPLGPSALRSILCPSGVSAVRWIARGSLLTMSRYKATMHGSRSCSERARRMKAHVLDVTRQLQPAIA